MIKGFVMFLLAFVLTGCATTTYKSSFIKGYEGDLPREDISIILTNDYVWEPGSCDSFYVHSIDSWYAPSDHKFRDTGLGFIITDLIALKPGKHTISVLYHSEDTRPLAAQFTGPVRHWEYYSRYPIEIELVTEPGHVYQLIPNADNRTITDTYSDNNYDPQFRDITNLPPVYWGPHGKEQLEYDWSIRNDEERYDIIIIDE